MTSILLGWLEFWNYMTTIGPGKGRPERPDACPSCDGTVVWFDGWRWVFCIVLVDGKPYRFEDGLALQRACCAECDHSWTIRPAFLYPGRSLSPDVAEAAVLSFLSDPAATYESTGKGFGCSASTVWRWVDWIGGALAPRVLEAKTEVLSRAGNSAALMPREVPEDHAKSHSSERKQTLVLAFQGLYALAVWARALPVLPLDSSPFRLWLIGRLQAFGEIHRLTPAHLSPPLEGRPTGPPTT